MQPLLFMAYRNRITSSGARRTYIVLRGAQFTSARVAHGYEEGPKASSGRVSISVRTLPEFRVTSVFLSADVGNMGKMPTGELSCTADCYGG